MVFLAWRAGSFETEKRRENNKHRPIGNLGEARSLLCQIKLHVAKTTYPIRTCFRVAEPSAYLPIAALICF